MKLNLYFPTVVGSVLNSELALLLLPRVEKLLTDSSLLTNQWGYKNTYSKGIEKHEEIQEFVNFVKTNSVEFLKLNGYDHTEINLNIEIFASEMKNGDHHIRHTHPDSLLSGVFYLKVPTGSSKIIFHDPRNFREFTQIPVLQNTLNNYGEIYVDPHPGLFLIWQSWIPHEVPTNQNIEGRITLVFNVSKSA
jgi:uncharacterized protein (TIGR02466 family)